MSDTVWRRISITRAISFVVLVTIIVIIGILFYRVMANFLLPLFLAALLVVIFRPLHQWLLVRCGGRTRLAAGLTTAAILLIVLAPIGLVSFLAISEGISLASEVDVRMLRQRLTKFQTTLGLNSPYAEAVKKIDAGLDELQGGADLTEEERRAKVTQIKERAGQLQTQLSQEGAPPPADDERSRELIEQLQAELAVLETARPGSLESDRALLEAKTALRRLKHHLLGGPTNAWLVTLANPTEDELRDLRNQLFERFQPGLVSLGAATGAATLKTIVGLAIMMIALYFFLADGPAMLESLMRLSPLDDAYEHELLDEFIKISRAVVVATLLSALMQGVLAGIGFWLADVNAVFLLASITALFALIPFVGAASVWVPVSLWLLFVEERPVAAGLLALYGAVIVSTSDNVVKALVLHGQSRLHPLLALLSVLGGVAALGPIGILVGPMLVVFLQTLLNILQRELAHMDAREAAAEAPLAVLTTLEETAETTVTAPAAGNNGPAIVVAESPRSTAARPSAPPQGKRARRRRRNKK